MGYGDPPANPVEPVAELKLGGRIYPVSANFTRPSNTIAYTAGDVVSNSTSATTLMIFGNLNPGQGAVFTLGGSGLIVKASIFTDKHDETAQYNLVLYTANEATVTVVADNVPDQVLYANRTYDIGMLSFPAVAQGADTSGSTGAKAQWTGTPIGFQCASTDVALYGKLVNMTGTTPASGQNFWVRLTILQN